MATITMNNVTYNGNNIVSKNGRIIIDGVDVTPDAKVINIQVEGNVEYIDIGGCETFKMVGNVNDLKMGSGDVEITGDVMGPVSNTSGDIRCGNITGDVKTVSGDVKCGDISGSVKTVSGNIKQK